MTLRVLRDFLLRPSGFGGQVVVKNRSFDCAPLRGALLRMTITSTLCALCVLCSLITAPAHAFTTEENSDGHVNRTIQGYISDFVDVPEGGINWMVFGTTEVIPIESKDEDGLDVMYLRPKFAPEVEALDGQEIIMKGYIFPLDETEDQKLFLFGPFPLSCPFQYHVGPSLVLEVHADHNPVTFDYEPVTITGTLELVPDDPEYSVFYRLNNARQVK